MNGLESGSEQSDNMLLEVPLSLIFSPIPLVAGICLWRHSNNKIFHLTNKELWHTLATDNTSEEQWFVSSELERDKRWISTKNVRFGDDDDARNLKDSREDVKGSKGLAFESKEGESAKDEEAQEEELVVETKRGGSPVSSYIEVFFSNIWQCTQLHMEGYDAQRAARYDRLVATVR